RQRQQREHAAERDAQEEIRRLDQQVATERQQAERLFTRLEQPGAVSRLSTNELLQSWGTASAWAHESDRARGVRDALEAQARHQLGTDLRAIRAQLDDDREELRATERDARGE